MIQKGQYAMFILRDSMNQTKSPAIKKSNFLGDLEVNPAEGWKFLGHLVVWMSK